MHAIVLALLACGAAPPSPGPTGDGGAVVFPGPTGGHAAGDAPAVEAAGDTGFFDEESPDPWRRRSTWTDPGPFAPLLDLDLATTAPHWEVAWATSDDGHTWGEARRLAHNWSSLDLLVWEGRVLILGGSTLSDESSGVEAPFGTLFALHTLDLETWGSSAWPVEDLDEDMLTDPALVVGPDGEVRAVYYATPAEYGDLPPDEVPGDHDIRVAVRDGGAFVEQPDVIYAREGLIDPSVCVWDGAIHFFATRDRGVDHATGSSWSLDEDPDWFWSDAQVPFCFERDGTWQVVAQAGGGFGEPQVRALEGDRAGDTGLHGTWTDAAGFFEGGTDPFDGGCTSPVVGEFLGRWVMFCAVWVDGSGP